MKDYSIERIKLQEEYESKLKIFDLEENFSRKIPNIKLFINRKTVFIDAENSEEISLVLSNLLPTNKTIVKDHAAVEELNYPYDISLSGENNGSSKCIINYEYNDFEIRLSFDSKIIEDFIKRELRGVKETELHYYGGRSIEEINRIRIPYYSFKEGEILKWYGSHVDCWDVKVATNIINFLNK